MYFVAELAQDCMNETFDELQLPPPGWDVLSASNVP